MKTLHEMVKASGSEYTSVMDAVKATGLKGRMVRGERTWSDDDAAKIAAAVKPVRYAVRDNSVTRPERFATRAEAAEFAQEVLALPASGSWTVTKVWE